VVNQINIYGLPIGLDLIIGDAYIDVITWSGPPQ
jgi:hypothetical protein